MEHASAGVASGGAGIDAGARPAAGGDGGARVRTTSRVAALCAQTFCWCPVQVDFSQKF
jgi:hypothetical protein